MSLQQIFVHTEWKEDGGSLESSYVFLCDQLSGKCIAMREEALTYNIQRRSSFINICMGQQDNQWKLVAALDCICATHALLSLVYVIHEI